MGVFDEPLFIVLLAVILLGFEVQIIKIHQAIARLNEKIERK